MNAPQHVTELVRELRQLRVANATGLTVEQVETLDRLEGEHDAAYEAACKAAARFEPVDPWKVDDFEVKFEGAVLVTYFDNYLGWMRYDVPVRADGRLMYREGC